MTTLDSRWGFTDGVPNRQGGGLLEQRLALSYQLALLKSTSLSSISSTTCLLFTPLCGKLNYIPPSRLSPPPLSRRLFPQSFCLHTHTHTHMCNRPRRCRSSVRWSDRSEAAGLFNPSYTAGMLQYMGRVHSVSCLFLITHMFFQICMTFMVRTWWGRMSEQLFSMRIKWMVI